MYKMLGILLTGLLLTACSTTATQKQTGRTAKAPSLAAKRAPLPDQHDVIGRLVHQGTRVHQAHDRIHLTLPSHTNFISSSMALNDAMRETLRLVAELIERHPYAIADVEGYTDSQGSDKINQALSERRAHAVIAYLESRGIPGNRLATSGMKHRHPQASNATSAGRAQNRRVEIIIYKHPNKEQAALQSLTFEA